jgi:hypothetical protein
MWINDIDNLTGIKDVRNFMFGPVYPHEKEAGGDLYQFDRNLPIGII